MNNISLHELVFKEILFLGSTDELAKTRIPFYGDQLTRVRLQGAKTLRALAPEPSKRFEDIGPFVCTLWHVKQDFLHVSIVCFIFD